MSCHPPADDLAALFDAVRHRRQAFVHLLGCPQCASVAEAAFADPAGQEAEPCSDCAPAIDYGPVFRRAFAFARTMAKVREVQVEEAGELVSELLALGPEERAEALLADGFRSVIVAERLLTEARRCPEVRRDLVRLVVLRLECWPEPRQEVRDLRAEARVELADLLRRDGCPETAERELVQAAADLRESNDSAVRGRFCLTLAHLRQEQGRVDEACALIDRAADLFEDADDPAAQSAACRLACRWAASGGDLPRAAACFDAMALLSLPEPRS